MIALDNNILARFLLNDDEKQYRTAVSLLQKKQEYTAPPPVLRALVWVLQVNDCTRDEIVKGLRALFGLPNFKPMAFESTANALRWYEAGMDRQIEQETGEELSLRRFSESSGALGYRASKTPLSMMDYAADVLLPLIPQAFRAGEKKKPNGQSGR